MSTSSICCHSSTATRSAGASSSTVRPNESVSVTGPVDVAVVSASQPEPLLGPVAGGRRAAGGVGRRRGRAGRGRTRRAVRPGDGPHGRSDDDGRSGDVVRRSWVPLVGVGVGARGGGGAGHGVDADEAGPGIDGGRRSGVRRPRQVRRRSAPRPGRRRRGRGPGAAARPRRRPSAAWLRSCSTTPSAVPCSSARSRTRSRISTW